MPVISLPDEFLLPGTYTNWGTFANPYAVAKPLTLEALREALRIVKGHTSVLPVTPEPVRATVTACVDCGTWNGCVCPRQESTPLLCYLCSTEMHRGNHVIPRRCWQCERLYLGG
jgi:hypothetical protein